MKESSSAANLTDISNNTTRSDEQIYNEMQVKLDRDDRLNSGHMHISVNKGVINIEGEVDSFIDKQTTQELASSVEGVLEVNNLLNVSMPTLKNIKIQSKNDNKEN